MCTIFNEVAVVRVDYKCDLCPSLQYNMVLLITLVGWSVECLLWVLHISDLVFSVA